MKKQKIKGEWKKVQVTPCCKTRLWHFVNRVGLPDSGVIRCEMCNKEMDRELLEEVIRGLNPMTFFCDRCGISAEILIKQEGR